MTLPEGTGERLSPAGAHLLAPRLSRATLPQAAADVDRPAYDLDAVEVGVVHLGLGAFARAHQFELYERLLNDGDRRWGVCGVSLNRPDARAALAPQDGLYTLQRLEPGARPQIVGALREVLTAPHTPDAVLARLAAPQTRVVALTVTEKGYHLDAAGELDLGDAAVAHDLAAGGGWRTAVGWLAAGLRERRAGGLEPFLVLSCDNLRDNGPRLKRSTLAFLRTRGEGDLARWVEAEAAFPGAMVDSITPAADDDLRARVAARTGLHDAWPVQREPFSQWVAENLEHEALSALAGVGLTLTGDVGGYEQAKLRLLNGAHSAFAYMGLLRGLETVCHAACDPVLGARVEAMMRREIAPTLTAPAGLDLQAYVTTILDRFRRPGVRHRLAQIAADGSAKLPPRLLEPLAEICGRGGAAPEATAAVAAWMLYVSRTVREGRSLADPLAERLAGLVRGESDPGRIVDALVLGSGVFPEALRQARFRAELRSAYAAADAPAG